MTTKIITKPKFYLVWKDSSTWEMRNEPTMRHKTYKEAKKEALRLSKLHKQVFYVVAHQATVRNEEIIKAVEQ